MQAAAQVASQTAVELVEPALRQWVTDIRQDEARWCAMLTHAIISLHATLTSRTGAFYGKAMAIRNIGERLAFLNRGQRWVMRRLCALLPTVRDARLRSDLQAMLTAHQRNVLRVDARAGTAADEPGMPAPQRPAAPQ
ncbi:DUF6306 domain-containing protein [Mycetohabitans rhizoxinica]|uniref:DUF6306 domain-containing protein n=1 Tax=Mycetohabitans rhizoxinica TaxID=412963 RepID=UPI0030D0867C